MSLVSKCSSVLSQQNVCRIYCLFVFCFNTCHVPTWLKYHTFCAPWRLDDPSFSCSIGQSCRSRTTSPAGDVWQMHACHANHFVHLVYVASSRFRRGFCTRIFVFGPYPTMGHPPFSTRGDRTLVKPDSARCECTLRFPRESTWFGVVRLKSPSS